MTAEGVRTDVRVAVHKAFQKMLSTNLPHEAAKSYLCYPISDPTDEGCVVERHRKV